MRLVCAWCGKPADGLGHVADPTTASHGMCRWCYWLHGPRGQATRAELAHLRSLLDRRATRGWLWRLGRHLVELEHLGVTHFGAGTPRTDLIVWHLIRRCYRERLNYLQITSYVAQLVSERLGGRA